MSDFASLVSASDGLRRANRSRTAGHTLARAALGLLGCCVLASTTGCSTLRGIGDTVMFWRGDDDGLFVNGEVTSIEEIPAALLVTGEQMRLDPLEPFWPFHMGALYTALDSTARAETFLTAALELDPGYAPAAALLSKIYYDGESFEQAVVLLDGFIAGNPNAPDALRAALALHLEALGDVEQAYAVLDACSGNSQEARAARTFVALRGAPMESVLETARQALDDDRRSAVNHNNYGIALLFAGRPFEAEKSFMDALKLNDELPGALYNMAIVEAFYFFDEEAGRQWFARYQQYASDDPDDLASILGADVSRLDPDR